jgi:hypothetical protein
MEELHKRETHGFGSINASNGHYDFKQNARVRKYLFAVLSNRYEGLH